MGVYEHIKAKIIESGYTLTQVNDEMNKRNDTNYSLANFSKKLVNGTIRYNDVLLIADIIGKEIKWVDKQR